MTNPNTRKIGYVLDIDGTEIRLHQDYDGVAIEAYGRYIVLGPDVRDDFAKLFMQADTEAKAHAAEQAEDATQEEVPPVIRRARQRAAELFALSADPEWLGI